MAQPADLLLVINGSVDPHAPNLDVLARHFRDPRVAADLRSIAINEPIDFLGYFVMADEEVTAYARGAPVITDDRTRLDFTVARSIDSNFGLSNSNTNDWLVELMAPGRSFDPKLEGMCRYKQPVGKYLANGDMPLEERGRLDDRIESLLASRLPRCVGTSTDR